MEDGSKFDFSFVDSMKSDSLDFVSGVSDQDLNGFDYENPMPAANSVVRPQISV